MRKVRKVIVSPKMFILLPLVGVRVACRIRGVRKGLLMFSQVNLKKVLSINKRFKRLLQQQDRIKLSIYHGIRSVLAQFA
jgi:hypothetical protein